MYWSLKLAPALKPPLLWAPYIFKLSKKQSKKVHNDNSDKEIILALIENNLLIILLLLKACNIFRELKLDVLVLVSVNWYSFIRNKIKTIIYF